VDAVVLRSSPNALSATRSLGRAGLNVTLVAANSDPAVRQSRYVARAEILPEISDRVVFARLLDLAPEHAKPFLLATGDQDALIVARHQSQLREHYCFVCPSHDVLLSMVDKARLYEFARDAGFAVPGFHVVRNPSDIEPAIHAVPTPCYVKPALGHEWRRVRRGKLSLAHSASELRHLLHEYLELGLVAIPMEIIPGEDGAVFSVSTYIDRTGRIVGWRTKRKLRQYPARAGNGSAQEICDEPEVARAGLALLEAIGHRGTATVEFRRDTRDNSLKLIEINPRTSLCQELITASGFDIPLIAHHDARGLPLPPVGRSRTRRWVSLGDDFRAYRQLRREGSLTTFEWLASLGSCRSFAYFAWDDPVPLFARWGFWLGRFLRGRSRRNPRTNL
jgi:predicted ATP-grasp superfamily ATP-dependent carboligase